AQPTFDPSFHEVMTSKGGDDEGVTEEDEELVTKCLEIIRQEKKASTSMLQRRLRLGYTRDARVVDILEQRGIVGPKDGAKDREILVDLDTLP
ncbi:MAG: DNA translocase FtsK, partial [Chthoniobacterales bacterium]